jgi:RCC1-like G exchanging factor-like protein
VLVGNQSVVQSIDQNFSIDNASDSVISVKAGQDHSLYLTRDGDVYSNGWSADGQLGQEIFTLNHKPTKIKGDLEGIKIKQIETKGDFCLALSENGEIFGWGNNEYKQLAMTGINEPQINVPRELKIPKHIPSPIKMVAASGTHCLLLDKYNQVWTWGGGFLGKGPEFDESGEPSMIPGTLFGRFKDIDLTMKRNITQVKCGLNNSAVIVNDGSLFMWGKNKYGQIGTGDFKDVYFPLRVNIPASVKSIDLGADQTFSICHTII